MPRKTLVIIPTYNERESLPGVLGRTRAAVPDASVLIVDDGSPDGTGEWADQQSGQDPHVHVMHRQGKNGLGTAYLQGFAWGLEHGYGILCEMDADGSHPVEGLPKLLAAVEGGADLAIGSRYVKGGSVVDWPRRRWLLSRGGNLYIAIMLGLHVRDATAGFRAYSVSLLRRLNLAGVQSKGYGFQVDMTKRAVEAGARIVEVPIVFRERQLGESKMSGGIVKEAMLMVTGWGLARIGRGIAHVAHIASGKDDSGHRSRRNRGGGR